MRGLAREKLVVVVETIRMILRSGGKERVPREWLNRILNGPDLAVDRRRAFLETAGKRRTTKDGESLEPRRFRAAVGPRAIRQLEGVLLLVGRIANRVLG